MRREFPRSIRREIVKRSRNEAGQICCEGCGMVLDGLAFEIDHTIPEALIVNNAPPLTADDGKLLGKKCCHRAKTPHDIRRIRKSDRQMDKDSGAFKPSSRGFASSRFRKRMDGTVVDRATGAPMRRQ